ncbi:MAG: AEC family transporter [Acidimicrobiia bacterium]|nr:AEC family transporter [Acidimicrobiia bacterium]
MSVAELLVDVMGPVVLVVGVGWLAGRRLHFDVQTLSRLAFWILGGAFVLDVFADAELDRSVVLRLTTAALVAMAVAVIVAATVARGLGLDRSRVSAIAMSSAYGNVGNAGLAISAFAFGDDAIPIAAVLMIAINVPGMVLGISLATSRHGGAVEGIKRALTAPMTLAALLAIIVNVTDWTFPTAIDRSIGLLGSALIPMMLLTLGMQLAQSTSLRPDIDLGLVGVCKLVLVPLVAAGVGRLLDLEGDVFGVLVIQSAMPPAVFCAVVALEFDLEPERVTRAVLGTTLLALVTLPFVLVTVT